PFGSAIGCDPNRNYNGYCSGTPGSGWGALVSGSRTTHLPTDLTFMGGYGAWGKEIKALSEFFKTRTFVADITLHSYSELVLWPMGDGTTAPDNSTLVSLGQRMAAQMSRLSGGTYTPEQANALYPTNGGSCEWMYGWGHWVGGFPCMSYVFELGTSFYQSTSQLDAIERECFDGAFYLFSRAESIRTALRGEVPPPVLARVDSSPTGDFLLHWTAVRAAYNQPDRWELEELSGLTTIEDGFESGFTRWNVNGASQSTTQKHSGTYSMSLGTGNNVSNFIATKDPHPVQPGDSLRYWIWYNIENNYDVTIAEVSTDGLEWTQLHERYTGNSGGWVRKAFSLAPWVGTSVFIRLRYMTDDNTLGSGAYVDDVWPAPQFAARTVVSNNITDTLYQVTGRQPGTYWYRVRGHNAVWDWNAQGPLEDVRVTGSGVAGQRPVAIETRILGVTPNPTGGRVQVRYSLSGTGPAELAVYDAAGSMVRQLASGDGRGAHRAAWDGTDMTGARVPAGVYYVRLAAEKTFTSRVAVVR
ncbi:T9SS type A sorting domain-containing protein, partial [candidate division WOR-3 bacterium]|nr:T9SS type A sorting domain-containing protein [candidate division WOR-3 bacterium]